MPMKAGRKPIRALALATLLAGSSVTFAIPATAQNGESPEVLVTEGLEKLLSAIELFVGSIPMYAAPEVMPNGDIILRRIQPESEAEEPSSEDDSDVTDT